MSKRFSTLQKKKNELDLKEKTLRGELDEVSDDVEHRVKSIAKVSLIAGGAFLASYGLYKLLSSSKSEPAPPKESAKKKQEEEPEKVIRTKPVSSGFSFKNLILERLALIIIKFLGAQLSLMLNKKLGVGEEEEEGDAEVD